MEDEIYYIDKYMSDRIIMAGNYYKHHHPGGISSVVQYWSEYIEELHYYPTYKLANVWVRIWWFVTSYIRIAFRVLFDRNVKVVHLHAAADGSFWRKTQIARLTKWGGCKIILHIHASRFKDFYHEASRWKQAWIRKALNDCDRVIVLSDSWQRWFESIGIPSYKLTVLHNITAYPLINKDFHDRDGKVHFLFMGEIGERKGVFDILKCIAEHKTELDGKVILRIGGNKNEERLLKYIQDYHLGNMVKFEGWVSGEKKAELLNWADVFVLPSHNEGLPISILEAMSYGHPIISTPVGGIPEVVKDGENGVLVTPGDADAIYTAMMRYTNHQDLIGIEGKVSLKKIEPYLPHSVMIDLRKIYEELLS